MKTAVLVILLALPAAAVAQSFNEYPIPSRTIASNTCTSPDGLHVYFLANNYVDSIDMLGDIQEYAVPQAGPSAMSLVGCAFSPADVMYFSDQTNHFFYSFDPSSLLFTYSRFPAPNVGIAGHAFNSDGLIYVMVTTNSAIQRVQPNGVFLPAIHLTAGRYPHGPSSCGGNVWFAENNANRVAFVTPAGTVSEFLLPVGSSHPFWTICAPDGGVYFTMESSNMIGRIDLTSYAIQYWKLPTPNSMPKGIALLNDPFGNTSRLCVAESNVNKIGCMPLGGGPIAEYPIPIAGANPDKMAFGPDGGVWFSQSTVSYMAELPPF